MNKHKLVVYEKKRHSDFLYKIKHIIRATDTESMGSMYLESEVFNYFHSFFDAIQQAGLLDINCLDETEKFKKEFDDIYLLWAKHCGFWCSFRIINIVGRYEQIHGFDRFFPEGRFSRAKNFEHMLQFQLADYIKRYNKKHQQNSLCSTF